MSATFTIEQVNQKAEARFCSLLRDAIACREAREFEACLALLSEAESLVESVSNRMQGKFYNQRALALKDTQEYDRAILEFDRASYQFELCGDVTLQAIVKNNLARVYSLSHDYVRGHESVDAAISRVTNNELLGQFHDQKARIFLDQELAGEAEIESEIAVQLLSQGDSSLLAEALTTHGMALIASGRVMEGRKEIGKAQKNLVRESARMIKRRGPSKPRPFSPLRKDCCMSLALSPERSHELVEHLTANDNAEHAWDLIELLAGTSTPEDPNADRAMRDLIVLTPEFEEFFQGHLARFRPPPIDEPESESEH